MTWLAIVVGYVVVSCAAGYVLGQIIRVGRGE